MSWPGIEPSTTSRESLFRTTIDDGATQHVDQRRYSSQVSLSIELCISDIVFVTALHCASSRGHVTCVDMLLTSSANANSDDCSGCTPIFYAITLGHAHSVTSLLHHGANPNHVDMKGRTYILLFVVLYNFIC